MADQLTSFLSQHSSFASSKAKIFNDPIHGYITVDPLSIAIIDTPQFQRLRELKQVASLYYVFPGGGYHRFEHSVGVSHLAKSRILQYATLQRELQIPPNDILALTLGGLMHDLGHGPFSHTFQSEFVPRIRKLKGFNPKENAFRHEEMSIQMMDYLIDENHIDLDEVQVDVKLIKDVIRSKPSDYTYSTTAERYVRTYSAPSATACGSPASSKYRTSYPDYYYELIANGKNGIDVDKLDYLARDTHNLLYNASFDTSRLAFYSRVIDNEICYDQKVAQDIYNIFQHRYYMHKHIYSHKKHKAIEYMICDAMIIADTELGIYQSTQSPEEFQYMTDNIIYTIERSKSQALAPARDILYNLKRRHLYEYVDEYAIPYELLQKFPKITAEELATYHQSNGADNGITTINPNDIIIHDAIYDYNYKEKNPVNYMRFYDSDDVYQSHPISQNEVSHLLAAHFQERIIRIYSRSRAPSVMKVIKVCQCIIALNAFQNYLRMFNAKSK